MGKILTADEIARYKSDGLICPKRLMSADEAAHYLAALGSYETATGGPSMENGAINRISSSHGSTR